LKIFIIIAVIAVGAFVYWKMSGSQKAASENIETGEEFLAKNSQLEGVKTTSSGLQYLVLSEGEGSVHPTAKDHVKVHYHGTLIGGNIFDSSVDRGEPISFSLNQVISGWTEGVQLMVIGDKFKFFIPSKLAYGNSAAGKIAPGSLLIFEVELLQIQ